MRIYSKGYGLKDTVYLEVEDVLRRPQASGRPVLMVPSRTDL